MKLSQASPYCALKYESPPVSKLEFSQLDVLSFQSLQRTSQRKSTAHASESATDRNVAVLPVELVEITPAIARLVEASLGLGIVRLVHHALSEAVDVCQYTCQTRRLSMQRTLKSICTP